MSDRLAQGLRLLEALAEAGVEGATQAELARQLGTSAATISRLVATLDAEGSYVEETIRGLRLGRKAALLWKQFRVGRKALIEAAARDLRATAVGEEPEG